ncbi:dihydrofolate reductase [Chitinophaga skermanii]|uniref:Dihydrofolate reductase n=1 Tax=Chitinophaga skermanii TaxID=331697 RepID=A0A327QWT0_9BACT|nr:dihydrofolate reductase family protein [Chitinophaga skermanii]RAJ08810.1 dihydrofolate reductase [Chitinophaga skermanii]
MATLTSFTFITLNGFYKDLHNDISWHQHDAEGAALSERSLQANNMLLFGRKTYDMMYSFWPTPQAEQAMPAVAKGMNEAAKIVFSNDLKKADWQNTRVVSDDIVAQVAALKKTATKNMTILGSGSIVSLFASHGLMDGFQIMVDPVVISAGTSLFENIQRTLPLRLINSQVMKNGALLLNYEPVR